MPEAALVANGPGLMACTRMPLGPVFDGVVHFGNHRLVKTGRHQIDHIHRLRELAVLLCRHLAGHEDAQMANALVKAIDDRLAGLDDLILVVIEVEDPVQRLLRRRDVVAPGTEPDDRRFDIAQVDPQAVGAARSSPAASLLPTNSWSAIACISGAFSSTGLPHHFSNSRKRDASVSIFEYRL